MNLSKVGIVYRKELLDTLRDRRTLLTSIVLPILLFPLLMGGIIALGIYFAQRALGQTAPVMLLGEDNAPALGQEIRQEKDFKIIPAAEDYPQRINDKELRAAVEFPPAMEAKLGTEPAETQTVTIYHFEGELRSRRAVRTIRGIVREYRDAVVEERLARRGLSTGMLAPFKSERENVASAEKVTGNILGMLLPYFIILLSLTGALYPAVDLTAGEKERGTIETILVSPLKRLELVTGKFLLVLTASLVTTALSISSFAITVLVGAEFVQRLTQEFTLAVSAKAAAAVFFVVLPLAVTFSAVLLAIALMARSYREAQSYTAPLIFIVILPAIAGMIPGIELSFRLALIPILNVSLVAKEIFAGNYPWPLIGLVFGSTCVYAAAALFFAARQFNREEVLFRT